MGKRKDIRKLEQRIKELEVRVESLENRTGDSKGLDKAETTLGIINIIIAVFEIFKN